jgi:hypothetical protein
MYMPLVQNYKTQEKLKELISIMLESSFYLEMELSERLQLIKMLAEGSL